MAIVTFIAGNGGNGCVSFRREKFVPKGGPDGGDGGDGGNIILKSEISIKSLIKFKYENVIEAENGKGGSGSNKTGKKGKEKILFVPQGTVIKTYPDDKLMFDFLNGNREFIIAKGGKGGLGNTHFKSSVNQAPRIAKKGGAGESLKVILELKLIAFAGLVGFPNAGKSTLISKITEAKPKVANYPFTTLTPHLGVVYKDYDSLVIADIPGIIKGAHRGEGMGFDFLKHIERNRVVIFLIDVSDCSEFSPLSTFKILQDELISYKKILMKKKYIIAANKIDLIGENRKKINELKDYCRKKEIPYVEISALHEINLKLFKNKLFDFYHDE